MDPISKSKVSESRERSLANLRPWVKGQSGNPAGRPKKTPMTAIYEEIYDDPRMREAIKQRTFNTMAGSGMAGVLERREAAERIEGKVATVVDMGITANITLEAVLEARKKAGK